MQFTSSMYSNVTTSTRINILQCTYVHISFVSFETTSSRPAVEYTFYNGLLTNNATWCQNRGCICISSVRRTYGRIHSSFLHTIQTSTIILWTELFPKKRREKIQGEILQSIFEYSGVSTNNTRTTRTTVFPHAIQQLQVILHTELILLQEILQLQGSSRVIPCRSLQGFFQQLFPVSPSILHGRTKLQAP